MSEGQRGSAVAALPTAPLDSGFRRNDGVLQRSRLIEEHGYRWNLAFTDGEGAVDRAGTKPERLEERSFFDVLYTKPCRETSRVSFSTPFNGGIYQRIV